MFFSFSAWSSDIIQALTAVWRLLSVLDESVRVFQHFECSCLPVSKRVFVGTICNTALCVLKFEYAWYYNACSLSDKFSWGIVHILYKSSISSTQFNRFWRLHRTAPQLTLEHFHYPPPKNPAPITSHSPFSPAPPTSQTSATTHLLLVSADLPVRFT